MRTEFLEAYTLLPLTNRWYVYREIPSGRNDPWWQRADIGLGTFNDKQLALASLPRPALVCVLYMDTAVREIVSAVREIVSREWLFLD